MTPLRHILRISIPVAALLFVITLGCLLLEGKLCPFGKLKQNHAEAEQHDHQRQLKRSKFRGLF